jgi:hypothetical protein
MAVTITIVRISEFLQPDIEAAVRSVLDGADIDWSVSVLGDADSSNWNIGAQPGDGEPFHGVLDDSQHSVLAIRSLLSGWYQQYNDWALDVSADSLP